jgi:hypothetical protein
VSPHETIDDICKTLKLSPLQAVAVAYSLAQSQYIDSHQLLLAKLPTTVTDISFAEVHGDILNGLANMIASSQVTPSFDYIFICCEY